MYITDSTAARVDVRRMIPGRNGHMDQAPTLDAVQRKIKNLSPTYKKVVIQSGINDLDVSPNSVVEKKITAIFDAAKTHLPQTDVYMTSIINKEGSPASAAINQYIQAQTYKYKYKYIDTSKISGKADCFRDRKHPNDKGTAEIVKSIKEAIGLKRSGPYNRIAQPYHGSQTKDMYGMNHVGTNNLNNIMVQPPHRMPPYMMFPSHMPPPQKTPPGFAWGMNPHWMK